MDKIVLRAEPSVKELLPGFLENRRRDLERLHEALHAGDLAAIRDVGQNIRCFSRVYGLDELTEMGEHPRRRRVLQHAAHPRASAAPRGLSRPRRARGVNGRPAGPPAGA